MFAGPVNLLEEAAIDRKPMDRKESCRGSTGGDLAGAYAAGGVFGRRSRA